MKQEQAYRGEYTPDFDIYEVVASSTARRVLFSAFDNDVAIYDLVTKAWSPTMHTTFDFGGERLALSDELDGILAAAYARYGIAFYSSTTGAELWRRKDIKKTYHVTLSRNGTTAYCAIGGSSLVVLDLHTGNTIDKIRDARAVYQSECDDVSFIEGSRSRLIDMSGQLITHIKNTSFAYLDVTFAPGKVCHSEAAGPVRCIDIQTGKELWRYQPDSGNHILKLGYDTQNHQFVGIEYNYQEAESKVLIRWSEEDGILHSRKKIGTPSDCCFALSGGVLVTTDAQFLDSASANPV